jgi:hypothetical protein
MSAFNKLMSRGIISPQVHGILDYPLAAVLIARPLVLDFDSSAAKVISLVFGAGAAVLAAGRIGRPGSCESSRPSCTAMWISR